VVLLGAAGFLATRVLRPSHDVPELTGLRIAQVDPLVDGFDWDIREVGARAAGSQPGEVLEQDPAPGEGLREGSTLTLTVSRGEELAPVPDLEQLTVDQATAALDGAGLRIGPGISKYSEFVAEGVVLAPATVFTELPAGSFVPVVVSLGPRPRVVPEVAGSSFDEAAAALDDVGLTAVQAEEHSETVPEGEVIRSEPGAGAEVARDGEVSVVVSAGPPPVEVPDVVGRLAATAADRLEAVGLVVTDVNGPPNRPVCATDPAPGETVERGTEVVLATRC
jgi:beta-lactam-binding protein with PASTA domain